MEERGVHGEEPGLKETYYSVKRELLEGQMRPTLWRLLRATSPPTVSKETYYSVKRDRLHADF